MRKQIRKGDIFQVAAIGSHQAIKNVWRIYANYDADTSTLSVHIKFNDDTHVMKDCANTDELDVLIKYANQYLKEVINNRDVK